MPLGNILSINAICIVIIQNVVHALRECLWNMRHLVGSLKTLPQVAMSNERIGAKTVLTLLPFNSAKGMQISMIMLHATSPILKGHSNSNLSSPISTFHQACVTVLTQPTCHQQI